MKQELIKIAKSTEEALALAAEELGVAVESLEYEVLEEAKKGFLGIGATLAKVKITYIFKPLEAARSFIETLIKDMDLEIMDRIPTEFYCNCSKERVERALVSLGERDLTELIEEDEPAEVKCHFCNKTYNVTEERLRSFLK